MSDARKNFAIATVATAPVPATTGTTLTLAAGTGTRFPAAPFNAVIHPSGTAPDPTNAEIVRVTDLTGDTVTMTRIQEGTSARTVKPGDVFGAYITKKMLDDIETGAAGGDPGAAGANGAEIITFGPALDTDVSATNDIYGYFVAPIAYTLQTPVALALRGTPLPAGNTDVDLQLATTGGVGGTFTSVFSNATDRPQLLGGLSIGLSGPVGTTTVPAGSVLRAQVISAPSSGGSVTFRTPVQASTGASPATVTSQNIPVGITGLAAGDLMFCVLHVSASTVVWPTGWTAAGTPLPAGDGTINQWLHVATKTATASESTTQAVTFAASPVAIVTGAITSVTFATAKTTAAVVTTTATTGATTATTTTVASSVLVHIAALRTTAGGTAGTVTWTGLTNDITSQSTRATNPNFAIGLTHETQVATGSTTARTATWTTASTRVMGTIVFEPPAGTTPKGLEVIARLVAA